MSLYYSDCKYVFFGDSHVYYNFRSMENSVIIMESKTMHSLGIEGIKGFREEGIKDKIVILSFGEIDVRHRIHNEVEKGRDIFEIVNTLVYGYIKVINKINCKCVIVCGILYQSEKGYEAVGTYYQRVAYRNLLNNVLNRRIIENGNIFYDIPDIYRVKYKELTDNIHIINNKYMIEGLKEIIKNIE